ncbi:hypothetical protein D9M68_917010 [compost metagenome]
MGLDGRREVVTAEHVDFACRVHAPKHRDTTGPNRAIETRWDLFDCDEHIEVFNRVWKAHAVENECACGFGVGPYAGLIVEDQHLVGRAVERVIAHV